MRKLILVFASIAISAGVYAQAGSTNSKTSPQDTKSTQNQNLQNTQQDLNNTQNQNSQNQQNLNRTQNQNLQKQQDLNNSQNQNSQNQQDLNKTQNQNLQNNQKDLNRTQNQNPQHNQQDKNMTQMESNSGNKSSCSGIVMINGKMMNMNNGTMTPFEDNELTMINGTKVMSDGTYIQKNGAKMKMKEGYRMDMAGNIMVPLKTNDSESGTQNVHKSSSEKSNSDKTNNSKSGKQNVQSNREKSHADGVMMENGKLMKVKNGQMTTLQDNEITMSNGTKIMSDGTCIKKDGSKMTMKEGQHMDMEGNMVPAKTNKEKDMYLVPDTTSNRKK